MTNRLTDACANPPFPRRFYSQHGEDLLLDFLFQHTVQGTFVEVGCIDGRRFSNSLGFEERGWTGLCVEAHVGYIEQIRRNRSGSAVAHCAAGPENRNQITFYANSRGSLSTIDPSLESEFRSRFGQYFTGFEKQEVPMRRLDSLFREHGLTQIEFVSIDIEGAEVGALEGICLDTYRPKVFVIESDSATHEARLDAILTGNSYRKIGRVASNLFYVAQEFRVPTRDMAASSLAGSVVHTRHPLDTGDDVIAVVSVDLAALDLRNPEADLGTQRVGNSASARLPEQGRFQFHSLGFHGDKHLLRLVDHLAVGKQLFIETGANVGSTLAYVSQRFLSLRCLSCEPDAEAYGHAVRNAGRSNVRLFAETSQAFLQRLARDARLFERPALFWLDAHGYGFEWPLRDEVKFITEHFSSGCILIDDFRVPGADQFGFDAYSGQECSFSYIHDSISSRAPYKLYYPAYRERTSEYHPLRGWGLLVFGAEVGTELPESVQPLVTLAHDVSNPPKTALEPVVKRTLADAAIEDSNEKTAGSVGISDRKIINAFLENLDNPVLVSFPRTGSHWLRLLMELYFGRPSLARAFYFPERTDYLALHTHDMEFQVERQNVIYLYRDPVDTVYSQLNYYKESLDDASSIRHWAEVYGRHLDKWLFKENFTRKKTVLTYESMQSELAHEFAKLTRHFGESLDLQRLQDAARKTTKTELKRKTAHDSQVVNTSQSYSDQRAQFRAEHGDRVWEALVAGRCHLLSIFPNQRSIH